LTGAAASEKKDRILSVGHILQACRSGQFLKQVTAEWEAYCDKGRISEDYVNTEQHRECLQELLDCLDSDSPDEVRFAALKKVFLTTSTETLSDRHDVLPQQYMRICRHLTSADVLILSAASRVAESRNWDGSMNTPWLWLERIAQESGLRFPELVAVQEARLSDCSLITPRTHGGAYVVVGERFRLTPLGDEICRFWRAYDEISPA
jgi:hypothetical protein